MKKPQGAAHKIFGPLCCKPKTTRKIKIQGSMTRHKQASEAKQWRLLLCSPHHTPFLLQALPKKFSTVLVTSNLRTHAWSIKCS